MSQTRAWFQALALTTNFSGCNWFPQPCQSQLATSAFQTDHSDILIITTLTLATGKRIFLPPHNFLITL